MKKTKSLLTILLILCVAAVVTVTFTACDGKVVDNDGNVEYEIYHDLNYKLIEGTDEYECIGTDKNNLSHIDIASEYNGKKVTSIASGAFEKRSEITRVTIPESITKIGSDAFDWCSGITEISLGNVQVGDGAFGNCTRLKNIVITADTKIGADAFFNTAYYNDSDNWTGEALYLGYAVEENTFRVLLNVDTAVKGDFEIAENTTSIAGEAFDGCYKLTGVSIPTSVKYVGDYAFVGSTNIAEIKFGGSEIEWESVVKGENWNLGVDAEVTFAA